MEEGGFVSHKGTEGTEAAGQARLAQRGNIFLFSFFPCVPCIPWLVILFIMGNEPRNTRKAQKGNQCTVLRILDYHVQFILSPCPVLSYRCNGMRTTEHTESTEKARRGSRNPNCPNRFPPAQAGFLLLFRKKMQISPKRSKNMYEQTVNTPLASKPKSWPVSSLFQTLNDTQ